MTRWLFMGLIGIASLLASCSGSSEQKDTCLDVVCFENAFCSEGACSCSEGFVADPAGSCVAADPCSAVTCGDNGSCEAGACVCDSGYQEAEDGPCQDVDECAVGSDDCTDNAVCTNTNGSFDCTCDVGFQGDGVTCTDVDECADGQDACASYADCINTEGGFNCPCVEGHAGDDCTQCADGYQDNDGDGACLENCASPDLVCPANSHCNDGDGAAQCVCDTPEDITTQTSGPVYYLSPDGDDVLNDGSASKPWKTILTSLAKVEPGSTLKLSAGKFRLMSENSGMVNVFLGPEHSGSENAPKVIQGAGAGQTIITGAIPDFETPNQEAWVLVDEVQQIYRSKDPIESYYPPNYFTTFGWQKPNHLWGYDEDDYALIGYKLYDSFSTDNVFFMNENEAPLYVGPGLYLAQDSDVGLLAGHIYVRLSITDPEKHGVVQRDLNPNLRALRIFDRDNTWLLSKGSAYLEFADLSFTAQGKLSLNPQQVASDNPPPTHHWTLRRVHMLLPNFVIHELSHDIQLLHSTFSSGFPPWIYRTDLKYGYGESTLYPPAQALHVGTVEIVSDAHHVSIRWCTIRDSFLGIAVSVAHDVEIGNTLLENVTNDAVLLNEKAYNINVHHNTLRGFAGVSWSSGLLRTPPAVFGTIYIHHNLIELEKIPYVRLPGAEQTLPWNATVADEFLQNRPFGSHGYHAEAWNTYNNTIIINNTLGMTALLLTTEEIETTKYFLNNVVIQQNPTGRIVYGNPTGPRFGKGHGLQIADGNVYWRTPSDELDKEPHYWLLYFYEDGKVDSEGLPKPTVESFETLDVLKSDTLYEMTKLTYSYGFDGRSVFADPQLGEDFRPAAESPAATAQIDLSTEYPGWPHNDSTYIGAYPPAGAPIECSP